MARRKADRGETVVEEMTALRDQARKRNEELQERFPEAAKKVRGRKADPQEDNGDRYKGSKEHRSAISLK